MTCCHESMSNFTAKITRKRRLRKLPNQQTRFQIKIKETKANLQESLFNLSPRSITTKWEQKIKSILTQETIQQGLKLVRKDLKNKKRHCGLKSLRVKKKNMGDLFLEQPVQCH